MSVKAVKILIFRAYIHLMNSIKVMKKLWCLVI